MSSASVINLAYEVVDPSTGPPEDPSIILIHGMTSTKETWEKINQPLADSTRRKVYLLDMRNHGDSAWSDVHDYTSMAEDVENFMAQQGLKTALVVGHSMGGKIAMQMALKSPEKVQLLVVEDISPKSLKPESWRFPYFFLKLLRKCVEMIPADSNLQDAKKIAGEFILSKTPEEHRSSSGREPNYGQLPLKKTEHGYTWKTNLDVLEQSFNTHPNPRNVLEGSYDGPTLFVYGSRSTYNVNGDKEYIKNIFSNVDFKCIEGATHLVHTEFPDEFLASIIDFITKNTQAK